MNNYKFINNILILIVNYLAVAWDGYDLNVSLDNRSAKFVRENPFMFVVTLWDWRPNKKLESNTVFFRQVFYREWNNFQCTRVWATFCGEKAYWWGCTISGSLAPRREQVWVRIPRTSLRWGRVDNKSLISRASSEGRASALQAEGHWFEPSALDQQQLFPCLSLPLAGGMITMQY